MSVKNKKSTITKTLANIGFRKSKRQEKSSTHSHGLRNAKSSRFVKRKEGDHLGGAGKNK